MKCHGCQATKGETSLAYDESNFLTTTKTTKIVLCLYYDPPRGEEGERKKRNGLRRLRGKKNQTRKINFYRGDIFVNFLSKYLN